MTDDTNTKHCAMCTNLSMNNCTGCGAILYCSTVCQKADWTVHKLLCSFFGAGFKDTQRPSPVHYRGIFFAEDEEKPRLVWVHIRRDPDGEFQVNILPILANPISVLLKRPLDKVILTAFRDRIQETHGQPPKSLEKIDKELGEIMRGPMLSYGIEYVNDKPDKPADLDLEDLRHLVDNFRIKYDNTVRAYYGEISGQGSRCVRVNCVGDQIVFGDPEFEAITTHTSLFTPTNAAVIYPVVKALGLKLILAKSPPALSWRGRRFDGKLASGAPHFNLLASYIFSRSSDPVEQTKNSSEMLLAHGSFIVARLDKKELRLEHVQALSEYLIAKAYSLGKENALQYLAAISKEEFIRYWDTWKESHPEAKAAPSPYDV
ncbi:MYND-type zinc finger protein samB [Parastagonospora nodorum]|nr:MYND-type zinc finger protein samB [Parastagonospora nodorum]KAH4059473.1 MYND-type zinc finger protein samB [Parastagonospora nodorum]KAH4120708.1 MYND-type zinc finger protein samB [Parastagonospora nodorum]KAH4203869.1 MYND-type zinc finger protein samB [Parastagonospora nodorum]KAH4265135.1 MYND-type zinc finger protein samB [Parastagonospora nodorum]